MVRANLVTAVVLLAAASAAASCEDRDDRCFFWSQVGECERQPAFMARSCAPSCGLPCQSSVAVAPDSSASGANDALPAGSAEAPHLVLFGQPSGELERLPLVTGGSEIVSLKAGGTHLLVLLASGAVHAWGDNHAGQLGLPSVARRTPFTRSQAPRVYWPAHVGAAPDAAAAAIDAGHSNSGALLADGTLLLWGDNSHAQCGVPTEATPLDPAPPELERAHTQVAMPVRVQGLPKVASFSLGQVHTLAVTRGGEVWSIGDASFGAMCNATDVEVPWLARCELPLRGGEAVASVAAGAFHSLVVTNTGRLLAWGDNTHGQLGPGRRAGFVYALMEELQAGHADVGQDEMDVELDGAAEVRASSSCS